MVRFYHENNDFFSRLFIVFEERTTPHEVDDATTPSSAFQTPSSISSPTEPTKSTNLGEIESLQRTQDSTTIESKSNPDISDTRQTSKATDVDPVVDVRPKQRNDQAHDREIAT